jgi:hypothetical protein
MAQTISAPADSMVVEEPDFQGSDILEPFGQPVMPKTA